MEIANDLKKAYPERMEKHQGNILRTRRECQEGGKTQQGAQWIEKCPLDVAAEMPLVPFNHEAEVGGQIAAN